MNAIIFILFFVIILPALIAKKIGGNDDGITLRNRTLIVSIIYSLLLIIVNYILPFGLGGDGDDSGYFSYARTGIGIMDQMGYMIFLRWLSPLTGDSLVAIKSTNISIFLLLALCWYKIGKLFNGTFKAVNFFNGILLSSPLFFYFFYLYKDMLIVFLFSCFIYGSLKFAMYGKGVIIIVVSCILTMTLRMPMIPINILVLLFFILIFIKIKKRLLVIKSLTYLSVIIWLFIYSATNEEILSRLNISSTRLITKEYLIYNYEHLINKDSNNSIMKNIFLYFMMETTGLKSVFNGIKNDEIALRGITVLPWLFIGLPLFWSGIISFIKMNTSEYNNEYKLLQCMLAIILIFFFFSLLTNDTTRLRMPGFTAMIAFSVIGYEKRNTKYRISFTQMFTLNIFLLIFYLLIFTF